MSVMRGVLSPGAARRAFRPRFLCAAAAAVALTLAGCGPGAAGEEPAGALVYPRVLFLTTGSDGMGMLPSGANICLETFNGLGAFAGIADKSVLLDRARLDSTRIIVAPTIAGYHDADRVFSLSFLDSASMVNLAEWVRAGGILVAGENIGRNKLDGEDRVATGNLLAEPEWPLAPVFGYAMREMNLAGFRLVKEPGAALLEGFRPDLSRPFEETWLLVPVDSARSDGFQVLANWTDGRTSLPGITVNACGRGHGILVPYFLLLQPSIDGGAGDVPAIVSFYRRVFELALGEGPEVCVNAWPGPYRAALAVTVNESGDDVPGGAGLPAMLAGLFAAPGPGELAVFVTGRVPAATLDHLRGEPRVSLASLSFSHPYFRDLDHCRTVWELARLEDFLRAPVRGFRFPFSNRTAAGMFLLDRRRYRYESSIFVDHATGFAGSLFPYNLPVWVRGQYCLVSDVLELSPALEDREFYDPGVTAREYGEPAQARDARRFAARMRSVWEDPVRARRGMMILCLHAAYSGHSAATLAPVTGFLADAARAGGAWSTGLDRIADWWDARRNIDIRISSDPGRTVLVFTNRNPEPVKGLTLRLGEPGLQARARGVRLSRVERVEEDGSSVYLSFDLVTTAEVEVYQ
ncbi:MAG: hypothetical protein R6X14_09435 [bacterium]